MVSIKQALFFVFYQIGSSQTGGQIGKSGISLGIDYSDENADNSDSNHEEEIRIECDMKNLPNNTIEQILGQNMPKCCEQKGYISQKFHKVCCRYTFTLTFLIIVQQILLFFQKIFTYSWQNRIFWALEQSHSVLYQAVLLPK